ncbi:beta strand repeat-containing protein [Aliarcobacter cryaerophilus]|uniref:beta strand repeat-containing protein n=1 Tax=Aliarcobacter cryaerophilus TaxID=28198 RepID=UPI003DA56DA6
MTKSQKFVAESYAKYFGRAADADKIDYYGLKENGKAEKASVILKNIIADADAEKGDISISDFVNNAFQNLFGRIANTKEMNKYSKVIEKGKNLPINSIVKSAAKADKAVNKNKLEVAAKYAELGGKGDLDLSNISKDNKIDIKAITSLADLQAKVAALPDNSVIPNAFDGKTLVLTEGVDKLVGTNKNDLFIGENTGTKTNVTAADTLDGGKGTDTFKLYDNGSGSFSTASLPTLKNIENVEIYDNTTAADVDLTKWDSVETLLLVRDKATSYALGEKVTTVNIEDSAANQKLTFDKALTAATVGVNKVGATVTVDGTALKTLTVDASGKASNVTLNQGATTSIETLNITGKANLTLATASTLLNTVKTVDGSKAEGDLKFSNTAKMTSIKTGSGNDEVTVAVDVASGTTINLGAGNDKLVAGGGKIAAGSIIDGGAGIDTLDSELVNAGNGGVFANFEILSLTKSTAALGLDLNLLTKSTFETIVLDYTAIATSTSIVRNVSTSQSLTVNADATLTTLLFKDAAGTADAYTINFDKDAKDISVAPDKKVDAGTVVINGIETVNINSTGKTTTDKNSITLTDNDAKSLVITGDKAIDVAFTAFGTAGNSTNGLGVSIIDASAATGTVDINTANVNVAFNGLAIKGGTAADIITVNAAGGTLTGGAGNDKFVVGAAKVGVDSASAVNTEATGAIKTTITDIEKGDIIKFANKTGIFIKSDVSGLTSLDAALAKAVADAKAAVTAVGGTSADGDKAWFQYGDNTYIIEDVADSGTYGTVSANDVIVKLNGLVNLSNSTFDTATVTELTIA